MEMTEDAAERVPLTASDHPTTWRFDYPIFHAESREEWRAWLQLNHLLEPDDLVAALDASPDTRTAWDGFPRHPANRCCGGSSLPRSRTPVRAASPRSSPMRPRVAAPGAER